MRIINPFTRQTSVKFESPPTLFSWDSNFCSIGSCFADHISGHFQNFLISIQHNPYGITYNPYSISLQLTRSLAGHYYLKDDLIYQNELYHSLQHHGSFSNTDPEKLLGQIHDRQTHFSNALRSADVLLLTLGTAFVFEFMRNKEIVNNCHKIPGIEFNRYRLSVESVFTSLCESLGNCWKVNPDLNVIITVSPVRHIRDGLVENQRSKATLLLAIDELVQKHHRVQYFPAYEICLDELRDYRFYSDDLIHPSAAAVQYIIRQFIVHYFDQPAHRYFEALSKIRQMLDHRPLHPDRTEYLKFKGELRKRVEELKAQYPGKDFGKLEF